MVTSIDFLEFEWFLPTPAKPELAITIPNDQCFNLNQNLYVQMPNRITVGVSLNGKTICLREAAETGFKIPKSGTIKGMPLISSIKKRGIKLPARYLVEPKDGCWLATLISPAVPSNLPKKTPPRIRKKGLGVMLQKKGER